MKAIILLTAVTLLQGASFQEDFNSREELVQHWWVSQWGQALKQYADITSAVKSDTVILQHIEF